MTFSRDDDTGQAICPKVVRIQRNSQFVEGRDYEVTYENNVNIGTATAIVKGIGEYTGEFRKDYSIVSRDSLSVSSGSGGSIQLAAATGEINGQSVYILEDGKAEPQIKVRVKSSRGEINLIESLDYKVKYIDSSYVGIATVVVTGINGVSGSISKTYQVVSSIDVSAMSLHLDQFEYKLGADGAAAVPKIRDTVDGFTEGEDYWLEYVNCDVVGTGEVIVHGKGRFTGTKVIDVPIVADYSRPTLFDCVIAPIPDQVYAGRPIEPVLAVRDEKRDLDLEASNDYSVRYTNNVNVGSAQAKLGPGSYYVGYDGSITVGFSIVARNIADNAVTVDPIVTQEIGAEPEPTVRFNGSILKRGSDYDVSYSGISEAGVATAIISGKGNFAGTRSIEFKVEGGSNIDPEPDKTSIVDASISVVDNLVYDGTAKTPEVTVTLGSRTLTSGRDYSIECKNNINAGIAWVTITGIGNYTGTAKGTFEIKAKDASRAVVKVADQAWTGKALTPAPTVTFGGKTLKQGTDYTVAYSNNVNAGTATVTVTFKGNYTGAATCTFKITKEDPVTETVVMHRLYNPYTGEHLYTASTGERDSLASIGWKYEGVGWTAPKESSTPVYRLYNPYVAGGDHHYTTSKAEYDKLAEAGWKQEGVAWFSDDAKGAPLYRQYNPYATTGTHNYTTSKAENDALVKLGWRAEGVGWYGVK